MNERCKETVYPNEKYGAFHGHQCTRKAVKDGYCKIHHPDSVRKRQEISAKRYNERIEQSEYAQLKRAREEIERLTQQVEEAKRDADKLQKIKDLVDEQANDDGIWFQADTAPEAYLQHKLRLLHAVIEGDIIND